MRHTSTTLHLRIAHHFIRVTSSRTGERMRFGARIVELCGQMVDGSIFEREGRSRISMQHAHLQGSGDSTWLEGHRSSLGTIWKFTHTAQPRVFAAVRSSHQTPKPAPNPQAIEDSVSVFLLLAAPRTCGAGEGRVPLWIRPDLLVREAYLGAGGDASLCFKKHLSALVAQLQDGVGVTFAH